MLFDPMFLTVGYLLKVEKFASLAKAKCVHSCLRLLLKKGMVKYLDFSRGSFITNIVQDNILQTYHVTHMHKVSILQIVLSQPLHRLVKCPLVYITANTLTTSFISFLLVPYVNLI